MIALRTDCLLFALPNGESVPCSVEMISVEMVGGNEAGMEPELLQHAAASVFHYFKVELDRESVTVGEFSGALEKALQRLGCVIHSAAGGADVVETDLARLLGDAGGCLELVFFPRLRDELRGQLRQSPRVVRFRGLRGCVKRLAGVRRWNGRCDRLRDQIVEFLRQCLNQESEKPLCALLVV